jgi:hypothetical protein
MSSRAAEMPHFVLHDTAARLLTLSRRCCGLLTSGWRGVDVRWWCDSVPSFEGGWLGVCWVDGDAGGSSQEGDEDDRARGGRTADGE